MNFKTYFKDLIDPAIIAGAIIFIAISVLITMLFASKAKSFKTTYKNKFITYLIVILLIVCLITFLGSSEIFNNQIFNIFILYQTAFFTLGIIHCYTYRNYFERFNEKSIWIEFLFSIVMIFYMVIPMIIIYTIIKGNTYVYNMILSSIVFIIPSFIYNVFEASISIPPKVFQTWQFPEDDAFDDPPASEYRDMVVVTFVFHKDVNSEVRTEFRAKAPIRMDFGRLFFHFVNDYNIRNPDSPIQLNNNKGERQRWVFYLKSKNLGFAKYIRPDYPLYVNKIEENSIIICQRTDLLSKSEESIAYDPNDLDQNTKPKREENKNTNQVEKVKETPF